MRIAAVGLVLGFLAPGHLLRAAGGGGPREDCPDCASNEGGRAPADSLTGASRALDAVAEGLAACRGLSTQESMVVSSERGRSGLPAHYLLRRNPDAEKGVASYRISLHPDALSLVGSGYSPAQASACLGLASQIMSGPGGEHLELALDPGAPPIPAPSDELALALRTRSGGGDGPGGFSSPCANFTHRMLHLAGLPDLAVKARAEGSCAPLAPLNIMSSTGESLHPEGASIGDPFDHRFGQYISSECSCADRAGSAKAACRRDLAALSYAPRRCPPSSEPREMPLISELDLETTASELLHQRQYDHFSLVFGLPGTLEQGKLEDSGDVYSSVIRTRPVRSNTLLLPRQWNALLYPGCDSLNHDFDSCAGGTYARSCPSREKSCDSPDFWLKGVPGSDAKESAFGVNPDHPDFKYPKILKIAPLIPSGSGQAVQLVSIGCDSESIRLRHDPKIGGGACSSERISHDYAFKILPAIEQCARLADANLRARAGLPAAAATASAAPVTVFHLGIYVNRNMRDDKSGSMENGVGSSAHSTGEGMDISAIDVNGRHYEVERSHVAYLKPEAAHDAAQKLEWSEFWHDWRQCMTGRSVTRMVDFSQDFHGFSPDPMHYNHIHTE